MCLASLNPSWLEFLNTEEAVTTERAEHQNIFATESLCPGGQFWTLLLFLVQFPI